MENIFYSQLAKVVGDAPARMSNLAGDQWSVWLAGNAARLGVKQAEIEWSGVNDWLALQDGKVSKEGVLEYLDGNGVRVEETVLWDVSESDIDVFLNDESGEGFTRDAAKAYLLQDQENEYITKYGQYTLPGGENYREVLLTLPVQLKSGFVIRQNQEKLTNGENSYELIGPDEKVKTSSKTHELAEKSYFVHYGDKPYRSSHWDQPNVLAHVRVNDRVDADGKKVLFVCEIQSDWGQAGKKNGFAQELGEKETQRRTDAKSKADAILNGRAVTALTYDEYSDFNHWQQEATREVSQNNGAPNAPFVQKTDAWVSLALKRVIKMAVDEGYDKVAFINGEQSAERYDLSRVISKLRWYENEDGTFKIEGDQKDGGIAVDWSGKADKLDEVIGKDVADKIRQGVGERSLESDEKDYTRVGDLSGIDLKVGGEGMKGFYDTLVPNVVKDVLKKLGGGKMEDVGIGRVVQGVLMSDRPYMTQPGFTITEKMREIVMGVGVPLFQDSRGVFDSSTLTVTLLEAADESTFIHESGHFYLEVLGDLAAGPGAPLAIREDMEDVLEWMGVPGGVEGWQQLSMNEKRPFHEQFARGVEAYFMTGEAPVPQLEGMFSRFAKFLSNVYKSVAGLDVELTPKITSVFDRLVCGSSVVDRADVDAIGAGLEAQLSVVDRFPVDVNRAYAGMVANFYGAVAGAAGMSASDLAEKYPLQIRSDVHGLVPGGVGKVATDSVEFKEFFGASKVVGDDETPLRVYHGTRYDFKQFDGYEVPGWFSANAKLSNERYAFGDSEDCGPNVIPVYLSIKNPKVIDGDMDDAGDNGSPLHMQINDSAYVESLIEEGYDGIVVNENGFKTFAAFYPAQIKSVFNRGTWDRGDPAILHQSACVASMPYFAYKPQAVSRIVREGAFSGAVLNVSASGVVTQKINRDGDTVRHDFYALSKPVSVGSVVDIKYVGGVGVVGGKAVSVGVGR